MKLFRVLPIVAVTILSFAGSLQAQTSQVKVDTTRNGIKGTPFSADVVTETSRVLSDGTRIHQETHGKSFRDSEGRTRNETETISSIDGEKFHFVSILDPVENIVIHWDSKTKVATIRQWVVPPVTPHPSPAKAPPEPAPVHEKLGTMDIEGFSAIGNNTTQTIAAGKIGNDRPIVRVYESWYSPDLKVIVQSRTNDPEHGERTMKLVNIQKVEPDPSLFQAPQDYTVHDERTKN